MYTGNGPRQALHHVVVRVDHARNHDVLAGINHFVYCARGQPGVERLVRFEDALDQPIPNQDGGVLQFGLGIVLGGNAAGAVDQQSAHGRHGTPLRRLPMG